MSIYNFNSIFQQVDLSLLRHFFAIATFGGFSRASRATGVSQPALSLGLKRLEKSLGLELIDRSARPFELTRAGHTLLAFCQRFQGSFESVLSSLGASEAVAQKRLRIGTAISIGFGPLDAICARIDSRKETFELEFLAQNTYQLLADVHEGRLDAALVPNDVFDSRLKLIPLVRDRIVFVVGAKHRGSFGKARWRKAALEVPLLTFPRETPMRTLTDKICVTERLEFKTVYAVNSIEALKFFVEQGRGAGFVLRALVEAELESKRIFEENLPIKLPKSGVALAIPLEDAQSASARRLVKILRE